MAKILIVEDNTAIGRIIQIVLEDIGHTVKWCKTGIEAFDALEKQLPDLVITDMQLPGKNGKEIIEKMRSEHCSTKVPAIIMTANFPDRKTFPEEGLYQGLLVKPFDLDQLKVTVDHLISSLYHVQPLVSYSVP